ncbi:hypothetical protein GALMADRAFT_132482 [Galerina marginata CBS 339.88]|uniref:Uncharacterized protein n=1 Tax=Galerina marginata (strain CBS 339.88) TaxID=685588 RepID=A0A067U353_GALM3|nr:hypothetical protein GALMADRAFT_132482 [Galerina marginata CBS 339.88]
MTSNSASTPHLRPAPVNRPPNVQVNGDLPALPAFASPGHSSNITIYPFAQPGEDGPSSNLVPDASHGTHAGTRSPSPVHCAPTVDVVNAADPPVTNVPQNALPPLPLTLSWGLQRPTLTSNTRTMQKRSSASFLATSNATPPVKGGRGRRRKEKEPETTSAMSADFPVPVATAASSERLDALASTVADMQNRMVIADARAQDRERSVEDLAREYKLMSNRHMAFLDRRPDLRMDPEFKQLYTSHVETRTALNQLTKKFSTSSSSTSASLDNLNATVQGLLSDVRANARAAPATLSLLTLPDPAPPSPSHHSPPRRVSPPFQSRSNVWVPRHPVDDGVLSTNK